MPEEVKPLTEVAVIGKTKRGGEPFPISGQRGLYFFIPVEEFDWLREVNDAYKIIYRGGVKPLERIKIVGRGGVEGYRPFLLLEHYGRYLCILTEHLRQLEEINSAYAKLLEARERVEEKRRELEAKKGRAKRSVENVRKAIEAARDTGAPKYASELMRRADESLVEFEVAFSTGEYDRAIELASKTEELARNAKAEALSKIEEARRVEEEERRRKLEEKKEGAKQAIVGARMAVEDARGAGALEYAPELIKRAEESLTEVEAAFSAAEYDRSMELATKAEGLARDAKTEAVRKAEELRKVEELKKPPKPTGGRYVYCIVPSDGKKVSFGNIGLDDNEVYTLSCWGGLAAVVSDLSYKEYEISEDNVRAHERVVEKVVEGYSIVPAAFDQVFKNERILQTIMQKAHRVLRKCMDATEGKVELGVKAIITKEMAESLQGGREKFIEQCAAELFEPLNKKAAESVKGRLFSDRLVLNAAFLVDRDKVDEFSEEVNRLRETHDSLKIAYSGPWPPYSFMCIRIGPGGVKVERREAS